MLVKNIAPETDSLITDSVQFQASIMNDNLAQAFATLSQKQQLIATLCYALCYQDNEIARMIGISPQAVSKTRNLALKKLRLAMPERG
ncbi:Sigma-70, region 4 [compost metagenome]